MSKHNTLRVTEFKGLNKATNPHNIDDKELVTLENMFVTKNRGLESRKGYRRLGDIDSGYFVKGLFATAWSSTDDRLYYVGNGYLGKMAAGGTSTFITPIDAWGKTAQFERYRDKVLFLNEGSRPMWFNTDEELSLIKYPELQAAPGAYGDTINSNSATSSLEEDSFYQYTISLVLGDDYLDGESMGAKPAEGWTEYTNFWVKRYPASYPFGKVDDTPTQHALVGTAVEFSGPLYGFNIGRVKLFRRHAVAGSGAIGSGDDAVLSPHGAWRLLDTATITLDVSAGTYSFSLSDFGIITDITGTLIDDSATLYVSFTDRGDLVDEDNTLTGHPNGTLESPWEEPDIANVRASHMARLYNRIFMANIVGTGQPRDSKKVYFSYRGYRPATDDFEISGVGYPNPMMIFPVFNYFYCDAENVEDPITAITSFRDSIIVFTQRCMFLWREGMSDPIKISNDIGCIAKRTVVEFEGKLLWLAHNGIYEYNGSSVKNITFAKMQPYMDDLAGPYANGCTACVFDRKYFIAGPFEGGTQADMMLVYDYDVEAWHVRKYLICDDDKCYIDMLYTDRDGADEQLWAGLKDPDANVIIAELETGYLDQQNPNQGDSVLSINCAIKTKYYSFKAPDIEKSYRNLLLDAESYYGDIDLDVYIDDLVTPKLSFTHQNNVDGFILGSATDGVLGTDTLISLGDEIFRLSLERGLVGSRLQYSADLVANTSPLYIHMIGFDWTPRRKLKRRYGA